MKFLILSVIIMLSGCVIRFGAKGVDKVIFINDSCFGCCERAKQDRVDPIGKILECSDKPDCLCD